MFKNKIMRNILKPVAFIGFILGISLALSSCKKDTPTTVKITVRNASNQLVVGAEVILFIDETSGSITPCATCEVDQSIKKAVSTDYKGEAFFDVSDLYKSGSAGVAILDLRVDYLNNSTTTVIKIEPEIENKQTIYIQ